MTNISIHDTKQKWESCGCEKCWVCLPITWNTIRVDKFLVSIGEFVRHKVCWWRWPRLRDIVHNTLHGDAHIGVCLFNHLTDLLPLFSNDPSFSSEDTRNISLEHVQRVIHSLFPKHNPCPSLGVASEQLAHSESSGLVSKQDRSRIDKFLRVFCQHLVNLGIIVHIRETVAIRTESITYLNQLGFNNRTLVEDDENRLFNGQTSVWISDGLINVGKTNKDVSTGRSEDHSLKASFLFIGNDTSKGRETHVMLATLVQEAPSFFIGEFQSVSFGGCKSRCINHKEPTSLVQDFVQLYFFVVLGCELFAKGIELPKLRVVLSQFIFHTLQKLSPNLVGRFL
mmetsp:Transcript_36289/g.87908  ORF Transcript_36289/g.87908 Transcript_36289/m.87908 type:complete len:340 (-) Transcript_36289:269-1288(-)